MDPYSSGEELVKERKPYTITKQRERWNEEEHDRFLEALKLYGRAWQRIEEHIGTKTAVQIRSHAQKFFTKLEKEANVKGVPVGDAFDIDIPPPRPKRKPNNPYPRKSSVGVKDGKLPTTLAEKEPSSEKKQDVGKLGNPVNSSFEKGSVSEASPLLKAVAGAKQVALGNACSFIVPLSAETHMEDEIMESHVTFDAKQLNSNQSGYKQLLHDDVSLNTSKIRDLNLLPEKNCHDQKDENSQSQIIDTFPDNNLQASQNCPRHVPVQILDGSCGISPQNALFGKSCPGHMFHKMGGFHGHPCVFMNQAVSSPEHHSESSSIHKPDFHPSSTVFQHQDDCQSFLNISSMFSSLIGTTLLQNPAAHAAASSAATMWPCIAKDSPEEFSICRPEGFQSNEINVASSMAAIAASTVAAATAWWAAHGLLPLCPPFHPVFTCSPPSASTTPLSIDTKEEKNERKERSPGVSSEVRRLEKECLAEHPERQSASKSPTLSSPSYSEPSRGEKIKYGLADNEKAQLVDTTEQLDSNKSESRKQVDRSSCGSNTPSSSDIETDGLEKCTMGTKEKHVTIEEPETHDESQPLNSISRLCRNLSNQNDSWKAVSEEGKLAFQALFNREILPQSFPPRDSNNRKRTNKEIMEDEKKEKQLVNNHNTTRSIISSNSQDNISCLNLENTAKGLPNSKLGNSKLETCRTGFKPYKRCSVEASKGKMSTNSPDSEKVIKRLRLEVKGSP